MVEPASNINRPVLYVEHFLLNPMFPQPNRTASECPVCKEGLVDVSRDPDTLIIRDFTHCVLCGQRFIFTDADKLRRQDWNR